MSVKEAIAEAARRREEKERKAAEKLAQKIQKQNEAYDKAVRKPGGLLNRLFGGR